MIVELDEKKRQDLQANILTKHFINVDKDNETFACNRVSFPLRQASVIFCVYLLPFISSFSVALVFIADFYFSILIGPTFTFGDIIFIYHLFVQSMTLNITIR